MARPRQPQICCSSHCLRPIEPHEKAVAITVFACTLGMGARRTSKSERLYLCPQCAYRVSAVERPPSKATPFNLGVFRVLLDLVGAEPDVTQAAWEQLQRRRMEYLYPPALPQGEVIPPRRLIAVSAQKIGER